MARKRDHKTAYRRRIERGLAAGKTRTEARGHASRSTPAKQTGPPPKADERITQAVRLMNEGSSLSAAAKDAHVAPERLRRHLHATGLAKREGRRWKMSDQQKRAVLHIKGSSSKRVIVRGFAEASLAGRHRNAVGKLIKTGSASDLDPLRGKGITDVNGKFHPFQTDENELFRWAAKDEIDFHEIYKIIPE